MKTPNGQFSLWESKKVVGFGTCYMTFLCAFWMGSVQPKEYAIVERCITSTLFQASVGYGVFPFSLRKSIFIWFLPLLQELP